MSATSDICRWCGGEIGQGDNRVLSYERRRGSSKRRCYHRGARDCWGAYLLANAAGAAARAERAKRGRLPAAQEALL